MTKRTAKMLEAINGAMRETQRNGVEINKQIADNFLFIYFILMGK